MAFTYDTATATGEVRLLISDIIDANHIFEDEEIAVFLKVGKDNTLWSAALALETIASNAVQTQKRIEILNLKIEGDAVAKELRQVAASWRQVAASDELFDIVEMPVNDAAYGERYVKQMLREQI